MAVFSFKETKTTSMKLTGYIDTDNMTIDLDGDEKDMRTLLSPFNGSPVEIMIKVKEETDLEEPDGSELGNTDEETELFD